MQQRAFTLVELSIVLVILGLLIGGVLTGQSLIRAAELRSISTQQQRFTTAVMTFRDKYFAIPGDMTNAQSYWGIADANPTTCRTTASTDSKTCNGDGDGQIDDTMAPGSNEHFRFWQHLANAGLIEGSYSGVSLSGITETTAVNSPTGRIAGTLWYVNYLGDITGDTTLFDGSYGNEMIFGGLLAGVPPVTLILKPEEMYNIDKKTDDGMPGMGKMVARQSSGWSTQRCTDATASNQISANYLLSNAKIACAIYFRQQF